MKMIRQLFAFNLIKKLVKYLKLRLFVRFLAVNFCQEFLILFEFFFWLTISCLHKSYLKLNP